MKSKIIYYVLLLCVCNVHAKIIDQITFETGDASEAQATEACGKRRDSCGPCDACNVGNALQVVSDHVGHGQYSARVWLPKCNERAEFRATTDAHAGNEYWYGWSFYLPEDFNPGTHYVIVTQLHHRQYDPCTPGGSDHMVVANSNGKMRWGIRRPTGQVFVDIGDIDDFKGHWNDLVLHILYQSDATGFDSLWVKHDNGAYQLKVARDNVPTITCANAIFNFKFGMYFGDPCKGNVSETHIYVDSYRMGDSNSGFEEVRPDKANVIFQMNSKSGWIPFELQCDAGAATATGGKNIDQYLWDFGDGATGQGMQVTHQYNTTGSYNVRLSIVDESGDTVSNSQNLVISDPVFSADPVFGDARHYNRNNDENWQTQMNEGDLRYLLKDNSHNSPGQNQLGAYSICPDSTYTDFSISLKAKMNESRTTSADYAIVFNFIDSANYDYMRMYGRNTSTRLYTVRNSVGNRIDDTATLAGIPDTAFHEVTLTKTGNTVTVQLDGTEIFNVTNSTIGNFGKVGIGSQYDSAFFDDLTVQGATTVDPDVQNRHPRSLFLAQNHPNPFNHQTHIVYSIPTDGKVRLVLYNISGQVEMNLIDAYQDRGEHTFTLDAVQLPSGIYLYQLFFKDQIESHKCVYLK